MFKYFFFILFFMSACNTEEKSGAFDYLPSTWSSEQVISLCDRNGQEEHFLSSDFILENDGKMFYNKRVKKSEHEISVSFDFISDCCREFAIRHFIKEGVLYIFYKSKDGEACDCKCDYRGTVNLGDKEIDLSLIYRVSIKSED